MSLSRSAFYEATPARERRQAEDAALLEQIEHIAGEQPAYGYRRITQELRRRGTAVNHIL